MENIKNLEMMKMGWNKRTKLLFVDIPNIKKQLKEKYTEYIYDIENNRVSDDWEEENFSS